MPCLAMVALISSATVNTETWYGITVAPENRCSPYDRDDYPYEQSVELKIIERMGGVIYSPHTGSYFSNRKETDIDHIVSLSEAHDSGLCSASLSVRRQFASDLINLTLASPEVSRRQKKAYDAADWLPTANKCWYAYAVVKVRLEYGLTIDEQEARALDKVLRSCNSYQMLFPFDGEERPEVKEVVAEPVTNSALSKWDDNNNGRITCKEARSHGIDPVRRGHSAYEFMFDKDSDGVVCE